MDRTPLSVTPTPEPGLTSSNASTAKLKHSQARAKAISNYIQTANPPEPRRKVLQHLLRAQEAVVMGRQQLADEARALSISD